MLSLRHLRRLPLILLLLAVGCGQDEEVRYTPEAEHAAEVERNPYALTCGDIASQSSSSTSQRLVIGVEYALADEPVLRERVSAMTENRVGRSLYWAMTEACKGKDAGFTPGEQAVEAVRQGRYLVQPRPESWNRPEPAD